MYMNRKSIDKTNRRIQTQIYRKACMYLYTYVRTYVRRYVRTYVCMYVSEGVLSSYLRLPSDFVAADTAASSQPPRSSQPRTTVMLRQRLRADAAGGYQKKASHVGVWTVYLSIYTSIYLSICLSIHLSTYL